MEPLTTQWFNNSSQSPGAPQAAPSAHSETPTTDLRGPDDTEPTGHQLALNVGQSIGKYEIRRSLGQGGQARAFLAHDPDLRRDVVIKFYHDVQNAVDGETVLNEGRALARVRSPFVAQCHGADRHHGIPYLVLEYVPGTTLAELNRAGRLESARALKLASQIAEGLAAIHACGLLHLDLKPSNILIGDDDRPRIVDFGLATTVGSERLRKISGTPAYMAPEQARGEIDRIDARADVFGLGAVLYELLTGQPPYQGESTLSTWTQAQAGEVLPAVQREPRLAADVNALCMRCLAKDPAARWRSADELRERLTDFDKSQRKGFGFLFQLGRFKLQLSIGISLASVLLMIGAMSWLPEVFNQSSPPTSVAMSSLSDLKRAPAGAGPRVEASLAGASMAGAPMTGPSMEGAVDQAVGSADKLPRVVGDRAWPDTHQRLNEPEPAPARKAARLRDSSIQGELGALRDQEPQRRGAPAARHDFRFVVEPVLPCRRSGETIVVPAETDLALELSTDRACVAGVWLRHAQGTVVQLLPNEHDADSRMEPDVVRQLPPLRAAAAPAERPEKTGKAKAIAAEEYRYRLPPLETGELARLFVVARNQPLAAAFQPTKDFRRWSDPSQLLNWESGILTLVSETAHADEAKTEVVEFVIPVQVETRP